MKAASGILFLALLAAARAAEPGPLLAQATMDARREITLQVENPGAAAGDYRLPAGIVFEGKDGAKLTTLLAISARLPASGRAEVTVPAAVLTSTAPATAPESARQLGEPVPKLAPLLKYLADKTDIPRGTSQCAVFALLEDINFEQWQQYALAKDPAPTAAQDALLEALDAVGILHTIAPAQAFRLATDPELKLRALRQPALRSKALQLFGMSIPGEAAPGQTPPDLGQLLHTKPGDNCPICRMRAEMQRPASDL